MSELSTTIGMDLGDKHGQLCVLDNATGEELEQARVPMTPGAVARWFSSRATARVVLEVGSHSGWVSRTIAEQGHEVLVADPRRARQLMRGENKDDRLDAELLARLGRMDPKLLRPVTLRAEATQCALAVVRSRAALVSARTQLINHVRAMVKSVGQRLPSCTSERFHKLQDALPELLRPALAAVMVVIETLTTQIRQHDAQVEQLCEQHPQTQLLRQVGGVGPITALTYVLTIEDPGRFARSRQVGSYLGLCQRRYQSGASDPQLRVSKTGDALLRRLLVQSAHYIVGPFGPDSDLRRWGLRYAERGGRAARKRAVVAVARRLAVLLHRLWVSGRDYEPLHHSPRGEADAQAA